MIYGFTEEEVKDAVWQCDGSKSPGLDKFNINFIKSCWDTLKSDIMEVVLSFHDTGGFPKGCNATFLALIPKVINPTSVDLYRPIYLVGELYKIITKVLSGGIKRFYPWSLMSISRLSSGIGDARQHSYG